VARTASKVEALNSDYDEDQVVEFLQCVWEMDHDLQRLSRRMRSRYGITGPQRLVIRIVRKYPGITAGRVAEILRVHPSTLTGVFRRLEKQNLLRRSADSSDGRRVLLQLTAKGVKLASQRRGTVEQAIRLALARVSQQKVEAAKEVLRLMTETLHGTD